MFVRNLPSNKKGVMKLQSKYWILLAFLPLFAILYVSYFEQAFGQESSVSDPTADAYVLRNVEVWGLFYRMMVAAFIVGAIVQGTIFYVCWRYRESHKKNRFAQQQLEEDSGR
jgi:heme/copper-type cytochrome/quinol oxidase subunit 2